MRRLYLLFILAFLAPQQGFSQINPAKQKEVLQRRPPKGLAKTVEADSLVPAKLILSEDLNKEYQQKFKNLQEILKTNFNRNRSGKLQFYTTTNLVHPDWLNSKYRFANTMKELDHFESLLCQLNLAYLQPAMNEREGYQVLAITRELLRMKNKVITIVDRSRKKVVPKSMVPIMASKGMTVDIVPVKGKANTRMEGVQVYVVKPSHFLNCETCGDCLAPNSRCDLNMLKGESGFGVKKIEPGVTVDPGSYYIFVTENDFDVERVIYFETRTLELADAGKVIWLRVGE